MSFGRNGTARTHKGGQTFIVSAFSYAVYVSKGLPRVLRFREKYSQNSYMHLSPKKMQDIRCQEFNAASSLWPTQQRDVSRQKFQFYNFSSSKNSAGAKASILFGPCQSVFSSFPYSFRCSQTVVYAIPIFPFLLSSPPPPPPQGERAMKAGRYASILG